MQQAVRDALIAFMAATAQAQVEATREAQKAGIAHAKAIGDGRYKGRKPSYTRDQFEAVRHMLSQEAGISVIAKETGLTRQTVYRIKEEPVAAEAASARSESLIGNFLFGLARTTIAGPARSDAPPIASPRPCSNSRSRRRPACLASREIDRPD